MLVGRIFCYFSLLAAPHLALAVAPTPGACVWLSLVFAWPFDKGHSLQFGSLSKERNEIWCVQLLPATLVDYNNPGDGCKNSIGSLDIHVVKDIGCECRKFVIMSHLLSFSNCTYNDNNNIFLSFIIHVAGFYRHPVPVHSARPRPFLSCLRPEPPIQITTTHTMDDSGSPMPRSAGDHFTESHDAHIGGVAGKANNFHPTPMIDYTKDEIRLPFFPNTHL